MSVNLFCAAYFALAAWFWHDSWMYGPNCFGLGMNVAFLIAIAARASRKSAPGLSNQETAP